MRIYNFFLPFRLVSSPRVYILFAAPSPEFSWKCSVFSTRILWLSNTVLRHKTLKQVWKRQRNGTDKQGHKALEDWGGERWRQTGRKRECVCVLRSQHISGWWPSISFCYLKSFPNLTGSVYLASRAHMVLNVPALPSSSPVWHDERHLTWLIVCSSSAISVQCLTDGGYAFVGPITVYVIGVGGILCPTLIRYSAITPEVWILTWILNLSPK